MTAFANVDTAREAFLLGAYDFVQKPFDNDLLKETVARALEKISLVKEKEALLEENKALIQGQRTRGKLGNIIGRSERMQALYQMIETVAQVQSTVLVTGESGTGKELVARAIHDLSPRAEKPFVSVNCGAFTETLLESELFGYVKGSFTGANANRKGLFEAANSGTIFPRRDRRDVAGDAGQTPARVAGTQSQASRCNGRDDRRYARDRRHESRSGEHGFCRHVSRRSLLPDLRDSDRASAFARARGRHLRARQSLRAEVLRTDGPNT